MMSNEAGRKREPITGHRSLITLFLVAACAGCGTVDPVVVEANYMTYSIPFTDAAAREALKSAGKLCAEKGQEVIMTTNVCSLTQCTTSFQCVSRGGGTGYEER